jgi:hypothetical protein
VARDFPWGNHLTLPVLPFTDHPVGTARTPARPYSTATPVCCASILDPLSLNHPPSYPSRPAPGSEGKIRQTTKCLEYHGEVLAIKEVLPRSPLSLPRGTSRKWTSTSPILSTVSRRHFITSNRLPNAPRV